MQQVLPGDRRRTLVGASAASNARLQGLLHLRTGAVTTLLEFPVVEIRYTLGVLVYGRPDNTLNAVAFAPDQGQVTGEPVLLADEKPALGIYWVRPGGAGRPDSLLAHSALGSTPVEPLPGPS